MRLLFIASALALCILYYFNLNKYQDQKSMVKKKIDYALSNTEQNDVIFIGSSRTFVHINPIIIDSVCNTKSYNLGLDGSSLVEQFLILEQYLQHHPKPHTVVLSLDFLSLNTNRDVYNYPDYFSYAWDNKDIRKHLSTYHPVYKSKWSYPFFRLKQLSALDDKVKIRVSMLAIKNKNAEAYQKIEATTLGEYVRGFQPNYQQWSVADENERITANMTNEGKILLQRFVDVCHNNHIQLLFLYPPGYSGFDKHITNWDVLTNFFKETAVKNQIHELNFTYDSLSKQQKMFYNFGHLNAEGASIFSRKLADTLKPFLSVGK